MNISKNFTLVELTKSEAASRKGLQNTPSTAEKKALTELCENVLEKIRTHFGKPIKINSAYRSQKVNAAIGGASTSQHCRGQAADIEITGIPNAELAEWIVKNLDFDQVILEFYTRGVPDSGWVHVSYVNKKLNRKSILTATKSASTGKTVYLNGLYK